MKKSIAKNIAKRVIISLLCFVAWLCYLIGKVENEKEK